MSSLQILSTDEDGLLGAKGTARAIAEGIVQIPLKISLAKVGCYKKVERSLSQQTSWISFP
jgi:hypothetical protein